MFFKLNKYLSIFLIVYLFVFIPVCFSATDTLKEKNIPQWVYEKSLQLKSNKALKRIFEVFYGAGDWEDAYQVAKAGTEKFPQDIFWWNHLIDLALWTNHYKEALLAFQKLWILTSSSPKYAFRLFKLAKILKRFDILEKLTKKYPFLKHRISLQEKIQIYENLGKTAYLIKFLEKIYKKNKSSQIRKKLAELYMEYDNPEKAFRLLNKLPPEKLSLKEITILAYLFYLKKKPQKALNLLILALKKQPNNEMFLKSAGELALQLKQYNLAANLFQKLKNPDNEIKEFLFSYYFYYKKNPWLAQKYVSLKKFAWTLVKERQWDLLRKVLENKREKLFNDPDLKSWYILILEKKHDINSMIKFLEELYHKGKATLKDLSTLSYLYKRTGKWKQVESVRKTILQMLAKKEKLSLKDKLLKAQSFYDLGEFEKAKKIYEDILNKNQNVRIVLDYLDPDIVWYNKWKKWIKIVEKSKKLQKNKDLKNVYYSKLASWYAWKHEYKKAYSIINKIQLDPSSISEVAYYQFLAGHRKEAVKRLEKALTNYFYTEYEKKLIRWQIVEMEDIYKNLIKTSFSYRDNSQYGTLGCLSALVRGYYSNNLLKLEYVSLFSNYRKSRKLDFVKIEWNKLKGDEKHLQFNTYFFKKELGFSFYLSSFWQDFSTNFDLFWNEPEEKISPLVYLLPLKRGGNIEINYRFSYKFLSGVKFGWREFVIPRSSPLNNIYRFGNYLDIEPYLLALYHRGNELYWQYGLGMLFIKGKESENTTSLIPDKFLMPYLSFSGKYLFGKWRNYIGWEITLGLMSSQSKGITYNNLGLSGKLDWKINFTRNFGLHLYIGKDYDIKYTTGELKGGIEIQWKF